MNSKAIYNHKKVKDKNKLYMFPDGVLTEVDILDQKYTMRVA